MTFKRIRQYFCGHIPVETYIFTRTTKHGMQKMVKWECFKCGKRMGKL